jgi:hypothetical protein
LCVVNTIARLLEAIDEATERGRAAAARRLLQQCEPLVRSIGYWSTYGGRSSLADGRASTRPRWTRLKGPVAMIFWFLCRNLGSTERASNSGDGLARGNWSWIYVARNDPSHRGTDIWQWMSRQRN